MFNLFRELKNRFFLSLKQHFLRNLTHHDHLYLSCNIHQSIRELDSRGVGFTHPVGIVVGGDVKIGNDCRIAQNVTLGKDFSGSPTLEDGVRISAGSVVYGKITIGTNSIIAPNSVVFKNVPPNELWGGNPAKFIKKIDKYYYLKVPQVAQTLLSIIMVTQTQDKPAAIEKTLESILEQTYTKLEIIIIDNCSGSTINNLLQQYSKNNSRITVHSNKSATTLGACYNSGIDYSTGYYITFINPGDWQYADRYEKMIAEMRHDRTHLCISSFKEYINTSQTYTETALPDIYQTGFTYDMSGYYHNFIEPCHKMIYKDVFSNNNLRFPEDSDEHIEIIFHCRLILSVNKLSFLNRTYYIKNQEINSPLFSSSESSAFTGNTPYKVIFNHMINSNFGRKTGFRKLKEFWAEKIPELKRMKKYKRF